jgi:hypothetical protein
MLVARPFFTFPSKRAETRVGHIRASDRQAFQDETVSLSRRLVSPVVFTPRGRVA